MPSGLGIWLLAAAALAGLCQGFGDTDDTHEVLARATNKTITDALPNLPSCSRACLIDRLTDLGCPDSACVCSSNQFEKDIVYCVKGNCNAVDAFMTKNLTDTACRRPRRDRGRNYTAMSIALGTIAYVFVAIRLVFKRIRQRISTDDWVILTSLAVGIPCTIFNVHGLARNGMGKDVWTLAPGTIINFVLFFYLLEIFYITMMALVKIAICFFYLSIFHFTRMRQVLWATLGVNAMFGTAAVVTAIFQCTPVNYFWTQYLQREGGSCINIHALAWVHGAVNIAMNVWLIILPLSQVSRLELHWKKKLGVIVMFMVGMFDTVVSILRLRSLINFANTWNPTWDDWEVAWWSTIEINVGIICTCLPTLRLILVSVAPRIFGTGRNTPPGGSHHSSTRGIMVQTQLHITSAATTAAAAGPRTPDQLKAWELMADRGSRNHSVAYSAPQNT